MAIGDEVTTDQYQDFLARFPEFTPQGETIIKGSIQDAMKLMGLNVVPEAVYETALLWLSAHLLAVRLREVGMQIGAVQASTFGALMGVESWFKTTLYGQAYWQLIESNSASISIGFTI